MGSLPVMRMPSASEPGNKNTQAMRRYLFFECTPGGKHRYCTGGYKRGDEVAECICPCHLRGKEEGSRQQGKPRRLKVNPRRRGHAESGQDKADERSYDED